MATPKRRTRSPKQRAAILEAQGGLCAACGEPLDAASMDLDHWNAFWISRNDTDKNLRAIHRKGCHTDKTKADKGVIGHIKRIHERLNGTRRKRKAIPSPVDRRIKSPGWRTGVKRKWPKRKMTPPPG